MRLEKDKSRRAFLKAGAAGALASGALSSLALPAAARALGADTRLRLGFIGVGGKGRHAMNVVKELTQRAEIAAICDVQAASLESALKLVDPSRVERYRDYRKLLDARDIDAVVISTPDHWHALPAIHACMAEKDIYVEKPLSLRLEEGRRMVEAARRFRRVVQVGTQQRAGNKENGLFFRAVNLIRGGAIGEVSAVRCWNADYELPGIGNPPDGEPPAGLDWDLWLGPAPYRPYNPNRIGHFRWFWDYSGGKATDWGTHLIDIVQWAMDGQPPGGADADNPGALPLAVSACGRKFVVGDNRETPDTLQAIVEYPSFVLTYENRIGNNHPLNSHTYGIEFYGTKGTLFADRGELFITPRGGRGEGQPAEKREGELCNPSVEHMRNFFDSIESRKKPASDVEIGQRSTSTAQLINVALQRRETLHWDAQAERITNVPAANDLLRAQYRKPWELPAF
jgi:predicted dehydrogenase